MRLAFIVSLVLNILIAIAMWQSLQRERSLQRFSGLLHAHAECHWTVGDKLQVTVIAEDQDVCNALLLVPPERKVTLSW